MESVNKKVIFTKSRDFGSPKGSEKDWSTAVEKFLFQATSEYFTNKGQKLDQEQFSNCPYVTKFLTDFVTQTRRMWASKCINGDQHKLFTYKKHAGFFENDFYFDQVNPVDPKAVTKSRAQNYRDASEVLNSAPSHDSLLLAAEEDLRGRNLIDAAYVLSKLRQDPVDMAKKLRDVIDGRDKPETKAVAPMDALRLILRNRGISVDTYKVYKAKTLFYRFNLKVLCCILVDHVQYAKVSFLNSVKSSIYLS